MLAFNHVSIGMILNINDEAELLTGFLRKEAIGNNITALMPTLVGGTHEKILRNYLDTGKTYFMDMHRDIFFIHKSGYLFFINVLVKVHPSVNGKLMFTGFLKRLETNTDMVP